MKIILLLLIFLLTGCSNNKNSNIIEHTDISVNTVKEDEASTPPISTPDLPPTQLSTFSTTIYTKTEERQNNVRIACEELNGTVVNAGETFSFTDTLGPAHPDDGYMKADSFDEDGDIIQEYGGR